jgi:hypothetical protein
MAGQVPRPLGSPAFHSLPAPAAKAYGIQAALLPKQIYIRLK